MKKLYILILFISGLSISMKAQLTLTKAANEPVIGDIVNMVDYDSTVVVPKSTGVGQTWNFMTLTVGSFTETTTYTTVASVPSGSLFPSATIAASRGGNQTDFLKSIGSNFEYNGNYNVSGSSAMSFTNTGILYTWPISMGTTFSDSFGGTITSPSSTISISGTVTHSATGTGTVILPNGNTHTNCLQYREIINITMVQGTVTTNQVENKYMYFSSSSKFPIAEISYQTQTTGTTTSKSKDFKINQTALTVGVKDQATVNSDLLIYPNPASDIVNIVLPNNEKASVIEVVDITGKVVATNVNSNSIDVSGLAKAIYTIKVKSNDTILQKQLAITK